MGLWAVVYPFSLDMFGSAGFMAWLWGSNKCTMVVLVWFYSSSIGWSIHRPLCRQVLPNHITVQGSHSKPSMNSLRISVIAGFSDIFWKAWSREMLDMCVCVCVWKNWRLSVMLVHVYIPSNCFSAGDCQFWSRVSLPTKDRGSLQTSEWVSECGR